jgi:nicotinate-nucleotide pyrophosphorylase (carboxylating)
MKSITTQNETLEAARARNIADALAEDIGTGDWTAQLVPANKIAHAKLIVRQSAVLCGTDWFEGVIKALDPKP